MRNLLRSLSNAERLLVVVFLATLPLVNPLVRGDGVGYYAYIRSLLVDGDLRFENEWLAANASFVRGVTDAPGHIRPDQYTPTGYVGNHFTVGPAILWAPPLVATHLLVLTARRLGATIPADGYSWPYRFTMAAATAAYAFVGLLLAFSIARRFVPERWAAIATLGIWFGSSLPVYMYFNPAWSHALSAFAVSLFLWYWLRTREKRQTKQWIVLGLIGGLMINIYYPNAVFLIVPFFDALRDQVAAWRSRNVDFFRNHAVAYLMFVAATVVSLVPTLVTRKIIYGSFLASGYPTLAEWCWKRPWLLEVLFSSNHGLLAWTPIVGLALIGLVWLTSVDREIALYLGAVFLVFYYLVASYPTWHGLSSFGNRFFVSLTPIFVIGLAALLDRLANLFRVGRAVVTATVVVLIIWNLGLIFQWGTNVIPNRGPVAWKQVVRNQFEIVPQRIFATAVAYAKGRENLLASIQQEDMKEVETWASPTSPCR